MPIIATVPSPRNTLGVSWLALCSTFQMFQRLLCERRKEECKTNPRRPRHEGRDQHCWNQLRLFAHAVGINLATTPPSTPAPSLNLPSWADRKAVGKVLDLFGDSCVGKVRTRSPDRGQSANAMGPNAPPHSAVRRTLNQIPKHGDVAIAMPCILLAIWSVEVAGVHATIVVATAQCLVMALAPLCAV